MRYNRLGNSGLQVSEFCLGTMTFGKYTEAKEAARMVGRTLDAGVNFIDTANSYNEGRSETYLGEILREKRDRVVLATKFHNPMGGGPNDSGWGRAHIVRAVEGSLKRLRTDWIDVLYLHHVDADTPLEEPLRAVEDLITQGKVRHVGCSNFEAWRLMDAWWTGASRGWSPLIAYQPQYSLVVRDIEEEIVPACLDKGIGIAAWGPMAGGYLTGKYKPGQREAPSGTRAEDDWCFFRDRHFVPQADEALALLLEASEALGKPPSQVALRWVMQRPGVASAIAGARDLEQLEANLLACTWELDTDWKAKLDAVSEPSPRYPKSMEMNMKQRREEAVAAPAWPPTGEGKS